MSRCVIVLAFYASIIPLWFDFCLNNIQQPDILKLNVISEGKRRKQARLSEKENNTFYQHLDIFFYIFLIKIKAFLLLEKRCEICSTIIKQSSLQEVVSEIIFQCLAH